MGNLVFQATLGGQVNLVGPNTASTYNLNVPAVSSTIATTSGTETFTNKTLTNPVINGFTGDTSVVNIGSGQFYKDTAGNLGLSVTPSAWASAFKAMQVSTYAAFGGNSDDKLTAVGNNFYNDGVSRYLGNGQAALYTQYQGQHRWATAPSNSSGAGAAATFTQAMTLDASGNLGVGTTSPDASYRVDIQAAQAGARVKSTTGTNSVFLTLNNTGTDMYVGRESSAGGVLASGTSAYSGVVSVNGAYPLAFGTNGAERARIDSSGNLLVGTTTPGAGWGAGGKLTVDQGSSFTVLKNSAGTGAPPLLCWNAVGTGDDLFVYFVTETGGTTRGTIDYNRAGNLTRYNTTSDATLKNIIGDADGVKSIEILKSTRIREYSWKDDETNKPQIGVIAQELRETFAGAVSVGGDKVFVDEEGNETTQYTPWAVDKTAFTFHLVKGWQEHQRIIQELKADLDATKAELAALKG